MKKQNLDAYEGNDMMQKTKGLELRTKVEGEGGV
jgi:hypothetical protein